MEILIGIGICVAIYFFIKKTRGGPGAVSSTPDISISVSTRSQERSAPRGSAWETVIENGALKLLPSKSVVLTLVGDQSGVSEVERYLRSSATVYFPERAMALAIHMSRYNVECSEVEEWRKKVVSAVNGTAKKAVSQQHDIKALSQSDPELLNDLLVEASNQAFEELNERPSYFRTLDELQIERPADLASDDAFLQSVSHDPKLIRLFSYALGRVGKVTIVQEGQGLPEWVEMVSAGLAIRGTMIPAAALAEAYKLADVNAAAQPDKPVRRKADAVALITAEVAVRLPNINRAFMVKPVDPTIEKGMQNFGWAYSHACLLLETLRCAEHVKVQLERGIGDDGSWHIDGECCKPSKTASERDYTRRLPTSLPPFHVGCQARLDSML